MTLKTFITTTAIAAIASTSLSAPARADQDTERLAGYLVGAAIIAAIIHENRKDKKRDAAAASTRPQPHRHGAHRPHRHGSHGHHTHSPRRHSHANPQRQHSHGAPVRQHSHATQPRRNPVRAHSHGVRPPRHQRACEFHYHGRNSSTRPTIRHRHGPECRGVRKANGDLISTRGHGHNNSHHGHGRGRQHRHGEGRDAVVHRH